MAGDGRGSALGRAGRPDPDSLGRLYDDHADALLAYLLRRTGSAEHAAELLAEVFACALASHARAHVNGRPQEAVSNCGIELEDGENFTLGRVVVLPGGEIAFLWPARHAVCLGVAGLGACPGVRVLRQHGVAIGGGFNQGVPRGMMRVFGVARDEVNRIAFTLPDRSEVTAPITDNAFSLLLPIEKITAERVDDDGSRHVVPGVPDRTVLGADAP